MGSIIAPLYQHSQRLTYPLSLLENAVKIDELIPEPGWKSFDISLWFRDAIAAFDQWLRTDSSKVWFAKPYAIGKLPLPMTPEDYVPSRLEKSGVCMLPIEHHHALRVASLPPHHRDPFDRLLVAQSQIEETPLLAADKQLTCYKVPLLTP